MLRTDPSGMISARPQLQYRFAPDKRKAGTKTDSGQPPVIKNVVCRGSWVQGRRGPVLSEVLSDDLVRCAEAGDAQAQRKLFSALYDELRQMARRQLQRSGGGLPLGATTLLHETFVKLSGREPCAFPDRARFMAYACRAMRSIVIDFARSHQAQKRGGAFEITALPTEVPERQSVDHSELERLADAIDALAAIEPGLAQVVDLKFFCGFSFAEIASLRSISERTVQRDWEKARMFLHRALQNAETLL
jgi:RNA polymerase sigma factor (TIGR02999 family)